jgi:3-oxoacyl-[acyl-carrier-protein] synthase III
MASLTVRNAAIRGIASAVPARIEGTDDLVKVCGREDTQKIAQATGVHDRHISEPGQCASDLCFHAAGRLLEELGWEKDSVGALIFVSQTFDFVCPATSCYLHGRLGLSKDCIAFDIAQGCSGYVYGLWNAASIIAGGGRRVLLLVGDTLSKIVSPLDKSTAPLFGDAGTATALEYDESGSMHFEFGTDGAGYRHLIVPAGGFRQTRNNETAKRTERDGGNVRSDEDLFMDGAEIFTFTIREVPEMISKVLASINWSVADVDAFVFHQANKFMLDYLAKKMRMPPDRVPYSLEKFGNTSSASIPITISQNLRYSVENQRNRFVLAGFGVGLSWGAVAFESGPLVLPDLEGVQ